MESGLPIETIYRDGNIDLIASRVNEQGELTGEPILLRRQDSEWATQTFAMDIGRENYRSARGLQRDDLCTQYKKRRTTPREF